MTRRAVQLQRISRRGLISSAVLAGVLSATGVQVQARQRGGVLRLGLSGAVEDWTPRTDGGTAMMVAGQGAVYDTLTRISAGGELTGELALNWDPAEGARVWTVDLRPGILFHDGAPLTAGDVVASFDLHRGNGALGALVDGMRAIDPLKIGVTLTVAEPNFPLLLADPRLTIARGGVFDGMGTGLYRVEDAVPGARLRLSRVADHYRGAEAGWFDAVVIRSIPDAADRTAALLAGHVDAIDAPADPEAIAARRGLHLVETAASGLWQKAGDPPSFTLAHNARLCHDDIIGDLGPMDSGRIAERWWFA